MSIEKDLKRMADAQETIAAKLSELCNRFEHIGAAVSSVPTPPAPTATQVPEPPKQPAQPAAPAEVPTPPAASPAATVPAAPTVASPSEVPTPPAAAPAMTPEQLNAALVAEMKRLGSRDPIDNALKAMGVSGIQELPAERYAELLNNVKAL